MASPMKPGLDAFHKERSRCLDAFAELENAIYTLLELTGSKVGSEPLGGKIELLSKAKAGPRYSKARKDRVQASLGRLRELAERRNDLVHSQLRLAIVEDEHWAQFTNVRQRERGCGHPLQLTLEGMRSLARDSSRLAADLTVP